MNLKHNLIENQFTIIKPMRNCAYGRMENWNVKKSRTSLAHF